MGSCVPSRFRYDPRWNRFPCLQSSGESVFSAGRLVSGHDLGSPYTNLLTVRLKTCQRLFQLVVSNRHFYFSCLRELDQLKFDLFRKFGLHHSNVRQPLPRLWSKYLLESSLLLSFKLPSRLRLPLFIDGGTLKIRVSPLP